MSPSSVCHRIINNFTKRMKCKISPPSIRQYGAMTDIAEWFCDDHIGNLFLVFDTLRRRQLQPYTLGKHNLSHLWEGLTNPISQLCLIYEYISPSKMPPKTRKMAESDGCFWARLPWRHKCGQIDKIITIILIALAILVNAINIHIC